MWVYAWGTRNEETQMTTTNDRDGEIKFDTNLRAFLREVRACQCLALAAWAAKVLRAGKMQMNDLERCLNLGFEF